MDSIAALKLHDYALRRKERMKNRFKLWDEIKGTTRELEISGAEVAFMEFQEIIAAWKIKYYVTKARDRERCRGHDTDKKALVRQCKNLKKKNSQLQESIDAHLSLNLAEEAQRLLGEKAALEEALDESQDLCSGLREDIKGHETRYAQLEDVLAEQRLAAEEEAAASLRRVEDAQGETSLAREDLEVSRRTAQDYLRSVMQLEVTLQQRVDEITGLREGDLQESRQKSLQLDAQRDELQRLVTAGRGDAEQIQALEQTVEGLKCDLAAEQQRRKETVVASDGIAANNTSLNSQVEEQQVKIHSLEKLVTEVTYQKEQLTRQLAEKGVVAGNYLVETVQLKEVIAEKQNDLEEHRFALSQLEEYTKYAQDVNEIANAERESALMSGEDLLVQLQGGKDTLEQNVDYCRMLESQLLSVRRKEHYSKVKTVRTPQQQEGDQNVFSEKFDFSAEGTGDESSFEHPLEGRLVSLLSVLEGKLGHLDEGVAASSRRKSIEKLSKDSKSNGEASKKAAPNAIKDSMATELVPSKEKEDNESVTEEEKGSDDNDAAEKQPAGEEEEEEVDWEEVCVVLENQLVSEKMKLEGFKEQLAEARENIQRMQKEKEKLKADIKKWQKNEQKRTGKFPTAKGNSVDSRKLFSRSDEVETEMQKHLVDAQNIATTALNCKMECDRVQDELYEADAEAYEVRLAAQQEQQSAQQQQRLADRKQEQQSGQEQEQDQNQSLQPVAPPKVKRNENRATISMLNQDHFTSNLPKREEKDLTVLREEDEEDDEEDEEEDEIRPNRDQGGGESFNFHDNHANTLQEKSIENASNSLDLSLAGGSLDSGELAKLDQEYMQQMGVEVLDRRGSEHLFRLIHSKLNHHSSVLQDLEEEKAVSRGHIEKWTLYFLRDQGRVPGLADSKYGANNLVFHNFNAIEGDIYSHHQTIQSIFSDFDLKRDGILNLNDQNLLEQVMQVEEHFQDPLFSLPENEEYEDAFKLHFESVETSLLNGLVDDEMVNDKDYLPNNTLIFEEIEDTGKLEILASLGNDIKSFQDDVAELHISLQDSRENAERLHDALKFQKGKIRQWHERFESKFSRAPTEQDKEKEASHLYLKAHEVHSELEAEMEKMRVFALIATAKNTEADRLKVLKRKFVLQAPPDYLASEESSVFSSSQPGVGRSGLDSLGQIQAASVDLREHSKNTFESKMPSIRSDAGQSEYRELRESLGGEVMKMSDELGMLKNFIRAADIDIDQFRSQKSRLKSDAKKWEQAFRQQHEGRKPTLEQRRVQAEGLYESYARLQEALSQALESRERAIKMVTKIQQNCDKKRRKLAKVIEKEEMKFPRQQ